MDYLHIDVLKSCTKFDVYGIKHESMKGMLTNMCKAIDAAPFLKGA